MILHLSANARLSSHLKTEFAWRDVQTVTQTPQVMTWGQWWQHWHQHALLGGELGWHDPRVISAFEATRQWELLLEKHSPTPLLNLPDTAKQLYQAWCLWVEYAETDEELTENTQEWQLFSLCRDDYQAWLQQHNWLDDALLMQQRLAWFTQGLGVCPQQIEWHGFDELTPYMQAWWSAAQARGAQQVLHNPLNVQQQQTLQSDNFITPSNRIEVYAAADARDEAQQAAAFCVDQLRQAIAQQKPLDQLRIAVVAPNLQDVKNALSYWLDDQLFQTVESHPILAEHSTHRLYNLSLGTPLTQLPYVQYLQQTLSLAFNPNKSIAFEDFSQWLMTPFSVGDASTRHALDRGLRRLQWAWVKWPDIVAATDDKKLPWPKHLTEFLTELGQLKTSAKCNLNQFVDQVQAVLDIVGGYRTSTLSSELYQLQQKWTDTLTKFAGLHGLQGSLPINEWLALWQRFCSQTLHQAQSAWLQPIQIMGMLEAGGQQFDALWIMGLDDEAWPRPAQPSAFLPLRWQRERQCPRCDAGRELDYARRLTQRLCASAQHVVMSFAKQKGEALSMPSPLITFDCWQQYSAQSVVSTLHQAWLQRPTAQWVDDSHAPHVSDGSLVPGGSGMLSAQMKCPLMAFLDYRLGAKYGLQSVEDGLASTDQGSIMHAVLEHFWEQIKTQTALLVMDDSELIATLEDLLEAEFAPLISRFAPSYVAIEKTRMMNVLQEWVQLEKVRPLGFEVIACEEGLELEISGIKFKVSVDRIDKTEQGHVLIDYKTGQASINDLLKEPIRAPQLAVYLHAVSALQFDQVTGLGYGLLSSDKGVRWNIISAEEDLMGKGNGERAWSSIAQKGDWHDIPWPDFLQFLTDQVSELATQVKQGFAPMWYDDEADLQYSASLLALRLPEVKAQMTLSDDDAESEEAQS